MRKCPNCKLEYGEYATYCNICEIDLLPKDKEKSLNKKMDKKKIKGTAKKPFGRFFDWVLGALIGKLALKVIIAFGLGLVAAIPLAYKSAYPDELIIEFTLGEPTNYSVTPGPHWIWPIVQTWERYDARIQYISINTKTGDAKESGISALSADNVRIGVLVDIHYKIDKSKGFVITEAFGYQESNEMKQRIKDRVISEVKLAVRTLSPYYTVDQMLHNRQVLINNVRWMLGISKDFQDLSGVSLEAKNLPKIQASLTDLGLIVDHFSMAFEPDQTYKNARIAVRKQIYAKTQSMVSQDKLKQQLEEEEINSQLDALKNKSKADSIRELAKASLETPLHAMFFEKWDGKLPMIIVVGEDQNILRSLEPVVEKLVSPSTPSSHK